MSITDALTNRAMANASQLTHHNELGDVFSTFRNVGHFFSTDDEMRAEDLANFINDHRYADAQVEQGEDGRFSVQASSFMPINQNIINSVTGLMECLAGQFDVDYEGWRAGIEERPE